MLYSEIEMRGLRTGGDRRVSAEALDDAVTWLETESHRIIRASRRQMADGSWAFPPQVGIGYEAFWLRDYEYCLEGSVASFTDAELLSACDLFIRSLRSDGAAVDCVKFDGSPVYQPGYGAMGENPVADGSQFTVGVAWHSHRRIGKGMRLDVLLDALVKTLRSVPRDPANGLVYIDPATDWDRCPYGFSDSVRKRGDELFSSLLFVQACRQLSQLLSECGRGPASVQWEEEGLRVAESIRGVFWDPRLGLFRAATLRCREHDIWGSAFAVFLGIADGFQSLAVGDYFRSHYAELTQHGYLRHLPGGVYWEDACPRDSYQNGGYWATPTGWFVYALDLVDQDLATHTIFDMIAHFKKHGACEWINGDTLALPGYLASAALPLAGIRAMLERRTTKESSKP